MMCVEQIETKEVKETELHVLHILREYLAEFTGREVRDQYLPVAHMFCPFSFTGATRGLSVSAHSHSQRHTLVSSAINDV